MSRDVTFRRINGRIVPIRLNKQQKSAAVGAGAILAGIGISAVAGNATKRLLFRSAKSAMNFFETGKPSRMIVSKALGKLSKGIRVPSLIAGSSLIGFGSMKLSQSAELSETKSQIIGIGGAAASGLATSSFQAGMYGKPAIKPFAKALPGKILELLKAVK